MHTCIAAHVLSSPLLPLHFPHHQCKMCLFMWFCNCLSLPAKHTHTCTHTRTRKHAPLETPMACPPPPPRCRSSMPQQAVQRGLPLPSAVNEDIFTARQKLTDEQAADEEIKREMLALIKQDKGLEQVRARAHACLFAFVGSFLYITHTHTRGYTGVYTHVYTHTHTNTFSTHNRNPTPYFHCRCCLWSAR